MKHMRDAGLIGHTIKHGVKLLSGGADEFKIPIKIEVTSSSTRARESIEAVGGKVHYKYLNKLNLRVHLKPHKFPVPPRLACPPRKWIMKHMHSLAPVYTNMPKAQHMIEHAKADVQSQLARDENMKTLREEIKASRGVTNPNSPRPKRLSRYHQ
eukprot:TRINITY_DN4321_c0_g1_i1.p1 TRINITY_DN4321_c0_g1~~TRINITY_DN4321_c0_g1_i1.p1  ORF type:complete len:155 (-),score=26.39 TRINITY_DN4321_c0_g1_i1:37-501(-)